MSRVKPKVYRKKEAKRAYQRAMERYAFIRKLRGEERKSRPIRIRTRPREPIYVG